MDDYVLLKTNTNMVYFTVASWSQSEGTYLKSFKGEISQQITKLLDDICF